MMGAIFKHKFLIGATALGVAAFGGGAYAATQSGSSPRQAFLNDVAKRLNVTPAQLNSAVKAAFLDRLDAAVKAGVLTQAQADRIKQRIEQSPNVPLFPGPPGPHGLLAPRDLGPGRDFGPAGPPPPGMFRGPGSAGAHGPLAAAAQYLGVSDIQLISELRSGRSLAQVAKARGKAVTGLEQAMIASARTRLDRAVATGRITKAQEQLLLSRLSARISRLVDRAGVRQGHLRHADGGGVIEVPPAAYDAPPGAGPGSPPGPPDGPPPAA
jgi:ribosomal protein S20